MIKTKNFVCYLKKRLDKKEIQQIKKQAEHEVKKLQRFLKNKIVQPSAR